MNRRCLPLSVACLILFAGHSDAVAAPEDVFALIVTNNRSLAHSRPDLHYADDDGARYYRVLRLVAVENHVTLLTTFDPDSRRLYPDLLSITRPPRLSEVRAAVMRMAALIAKARSQGHRTLFYFVFAGHGDVDRGKGYLELEDGRLGPDALENQIINPLQADVIHLVLDSCNSFFMINPRKPGGRRWATPRDMTAGFSKRHPNVGVFLSTNAEGEVYEWSEIQSGIFSHEVRSGLSGAADLNGDGKTSYEELESFVAVANKRIRNAYYRPNIFSRGPWNKQDSTLFTHAFASGRQLAIGKERRRLWVRDEDGSRLVDLHKEGGTEVRLALPVARDKVIYVQEEVRPQGPNSRSALLQYRVNPGTEGALLASLRPERPEGQRGHSGVFNQVFAEPYGPAAFADFTTERKARAEMVFGISRHDEARMRHYLRTLAQVDRTERLLNGAVFLGAGVLASGVLFGTLYSTSPDNNIVASSLLGLIPLGINGGFGLYELLRRGEGEEAYRVFEETLRRPGASPEAIIARTETYLHALAERDRRRRTLASVLGYLGGAYLAAVTVSLAAVEHEGLLHDVSPAIYATTGGLAASFIAYGIWMKYSRTPSERILRLYREDPDLNWRFGVAPIRSGFALGLSTTF